MENENKEKESIYDKCVLCGKITPYPRKLNIDMRYCYVEGAGQLCVECCKKLNERKFE